MDVFLVLIVLAVTTNGLPTIDKSQADPDSSQHHILHQICENGTDNSCNYSSTTLPELQLKNANNSGKSNDRPLDLVNAEYIPYSILIKQHIFHNRDNNKKNKTLTQTETTDFIKNVNNSNSLRVKEIENVLKNLADDLKDVGKSNDSNTVKPIVIMPSNNSNTIWVKDWKPYVIRAKNKTKKETDLLYLINLSQKVVANKSQSNDSNSEKPLFISVPLIEDEMMEVDDNQSSRKMNVIVIDILRGTTLDNIYNSKNKMVNLRSISDETAETSMERPDDMNVPMHRKKKSEDIKANSDDNCTNDSDHNKPSEHVGCVCALFDSDCPTDDDVPIKSEILSNVTCQHQLSPEDVCKLACISHMLPLFSYKNEEICSHLGEANNLTVYLHSKMCEEDSEWNFDEISSPMPLCCSQNAPSDCTSV